MGAKHLAWIVGLALVASAGLAAATFQGRSIWGGNNPGQGGDHAAMPDAALEHNRAGANHPTPGNGSAGGGDDGAGSGEPDDENDTGDGNETGEGGGGSCQPSDVPPAHATDGTPETGKPSDVPPAHATDGTPSGCHGDASDGSSTA